MHFQQSQRALDFMLCVLPEQRRSTRVHIPVRAMVNFPESGLESQNCLLRDMNMLGAFFFCKQRPNIGHAVKLEVALPEEGDQMKVICEGRVVRVEEFTPGAAIGVAVEFSRYELTRPSQSELLREQVDSEPFIRWTLGMVEKVFETASELAQLNYRCEPAA